MSPYSQPSYRSRSTTYLRKPSAASAHSLKGVSTAAAAAQTLRTLRKILGLPSPSDRKPNASLAAFRFPDPITSSVHLFDSSSTVGSISAAPSPTGTLPPPWEGTLGIVMPVMDISLPRLVPSEEDYSIGCTLRRGLSGHFYLDPAATGVENAQFEAGFLVDLVADRKVRVVPAPVEVAFHERYAVSVYLERTSKNHSSSKVPRWLEYIGDYYIQTTGEYLAPESMAEAVREPLIERYIRCIRAPHNSPSPGMSYTRQQVVEMYQTCHVHERINLIFSGLSSPLKAETSYPYLSLPESVDPFGLGTKLVLFLHDGTPSMYLEHDLPMSNPSTSTNWMLVARDFQSQVKPNETQRNTLIAAGVYILVIAILWHVPYLKEILYPFKLLTVGFHEMSHAFMGVLTCAHIHSIELDPDEGGATRMSGGIPWLTLPAGYLGSSLIGAALIACGFNENASKVACLVLAGFFLFTLWWARRSWLTWLLLLGMSGLIVLFWFVAGGVALRYLVLFIGVMSCMYVLWDVIDDTIARKVNTSDASAFARICGCCPSQVWGVIWLIQAIIFFAAGIIVGLVAFKQTAAQQSTDSAHFLPVPGSHSAASSLSPNTLLQVAVLALVLSLAPLLP